jgi:poly(3-hydroxyalkanoate) depolymerase
LRRIGETGEFLTIMNDHHPAMSVEKVEVGGQLLRVGLRRGRDGAAPLLLFNGIGASLELVETFAGALDQRIGIVAFDVPGVGQSPAPRRPYRFSGVASLANQLLLALGYDDTVDVLGVSWGGAVAQQFARMFPTRCRRLILAATSPGAIMVPGKLSAITKLASPRRHRDPDFLRKVGADIYGGAYRTDSGLLQDLTHQFKPPGKLGYTYQLLAGVGWTSLPWLHRLRQPTLILHGTDDPIVPLVNARILASLIPNSRLHIIDDGHLFLVSRTNEVARLVSGFLEEDNRV